MGAKISTEFNYDNVEEIPERCKKFIQKIDSETRDVPDFLLNREDFAKGAYGKVYFTKNRAVKSVWYHPIYTKYEYEMQQRAAKIGLAPYILHCYKDESKHRIYFVMDKIEMVNINKVNSFIVNPGRRKDNDESREEYTRDISKQALELMSKLHAANIYHGDLHPGNLGFIDGKMVAIDFGLSQSKSEYENYEVSHEFFEDGFQNTLGKELASSARIKDIMDKQRYEKGVKYGNMDGFDLKITAKTILRAIYTIIRQPQRYPAAIIIMLLITLMNIYNAKNVLMAGSGSSLIPKSGSNLMKRIPTPKFVRR